MFDFGLKRFETVEVAGDLSRIQGKAPHGQNPRDAPSSQGLRNIGRQHGDRKYALFNIQTHTVI